MDDFQKEGGNFLNLLQKEGGTQKGGGGSNPGGNYDQKLGKNTLKANNKDTRTTSLPLSWCHFCPPKGQPTSTCLHHQIW